ncbi:MAG: hypothetical protein JWR80_8921 [Bradyrhizobium sp.]|nr:hypothetical protein [Bradyrhizobium sp.]
MRPEMKIAVAARVGVNCTASHPRGHAAIRKAAFAYLECDGQEASPGRSAFRTSTGLRRFRLDPQRRHHLWSSMLQYLIVAGTITARLVIVAWPMTGSSTIALKVFVHIPDTQLMNGVEIPQAGGVLRAIEYAEWEKIDREISEKRQRISEILASGIGVPVSSTT